MCQFIDEYKYEYHFVTPYIHRANGQVERYMQTIMNFIRIESNITAEWPNVLWKIQLVFNTTLQKSINFTPLQAIIGVKTALIQAVVNDLSPYLSPGRNLKLDRQRISERLKAKNETISKLNDA